MSVLIILIIVSVLVAGGFLAAFLWSVKSGQMDDDYTPSVRMLFDDELKSNNVNIKNSNSNTSKIKTQL
jgi:cbb3-type cytochrome oxidase maturation protein